MRRLIWGFAGHTYHIVGNPCHGSYLIHNFQVADAAYLENAEWIYDGGSAYDFPIQVCCPAQIYDVINIELKFTRLRPFYIINLIIPALLLALCMLLAFLLPTECGERLGYSLTILLSYTVLLTITSDMMPTTSKQTPHIGKKIPIKNTKWTLIGPPEKTPFSGPKLMLTG